MRRQPLLRICATALLTAAILGGASAQETGGVATPEGRKSVVIKGLAPVNKELLRVTLPRPREFAMPGGARLFVLVDRKLPTVRISVTMRAGELFEDKRGVADLTAGMLDEGTTSRTAQQIARQTEGLGASLSASTGSETAVVTVSGLSNHTDRLIDLLSDVLQHPAFPAEQLDRMKFQTVAGLAQDKTDPETLAENRAARVFYGETPYGRVSPEPEQIRAITREDLVAFHRRYYRPSGALIGVVGDVDADGIAEKLRAALKDWKPAPEGAPELPPTAFPELGKTGIYLVERAGSAQTVLQFGNRGVRRTDPDYIALVVANRILGGGSSGRLFQNLREEKGYTYGAYSYFTAPRWPGVWTATGSVRTAVTEPAVAEFLKEIDRLQSEPVPAEELDRAKRAIVGSFARTLESPEGILSRTLDLVQYGLPADYWDTYPARIEAVTPADIARIARQYLTRDRIQLIAVGERKEIEPALRKFGTVEVYNAEGKKIE